MREPKLHPDLSCPECGDGRAYVLTPQGGHMLFGCLLCDVDSVMDV